MIVCAGCGYGQDAHEQCGGCPPAESDPSTTWDGVQAVNYYGSGMAVINEIPTDGLNKPEVYEVFRNAYQAGLTGDSK